MKLFFDENTKKILDGKYLLLDVDFLSKLFIDSEVFTQFLALAPKRILLIDSLVKFEFLRDVFLPKQKKLKEEFISNDDFFFPTNNSSSCISKIREQALLLSYVYAHQNRGNAKISSSITDLQLAARAALGPDKYLIITGNKKDFPPCVFNTLSVLNIERNDGTIQVFTIIEFIEAKFTSSLMLLDNLSKK